MSSDRTRLCLTLKLGQSVRIGEDVMTVICISDVYDRELNGSNFSALVQFFTGHYVWVKKTDVLNMPEYSVDFVRVCANMIAFDVHANPDIEINRLGRVSDDE